MQLRKSRAGWLVAAVATLALVAAACSSDGGGDSSDGGGGEIVVSGSSTVEPITSLVAEQFNAENPDVGISVDGPGTGDGFELFCNGETDISDASRPIKDEEIEACEEAGVEYVELLVGIDGLTVLTSPDNDAVECLDIAGIYALVGPESTGFGSWSDASELAAALGSAYGDDFPDEDLVITGPGEESGTYDTFVELTIEELAEEQGLADEEIATRPDYTSSPNDNVIVEGIQGSDHSFGWVGYAFFVNNEDGLAAIAVEDEAGECVEPTDETIATGAYPLSRPLFIYVNTARAAENPALAEFVDFYMGDDGLAAVADAGYVQLTPEEWSATGETWASS